jgi:hypothetical protein
MSDRAIDNSRTSERLSAFMSKIVEAKPVDNYFTRNQTLDHLYKMAKKEAYGRQGIFPIVTDENGTVKDFSDYDTFNLNATNANVTATVPMKNSGGSLVISWEEQRETSNNEVSLYNLLQSKRDNLMLSIKKHINGKIHATSQASKAIEPLATLVDSTGSAMGLSASDYSTWASVETSSGSFNTQGLDDMRATHNSILDNKGDTKLIVTTRTVYEYFEKYADADVRYDGATDTLNRGVSNLTFRKIPVIFDSDCASGVMYFLDTDYLYMAVDSDGDFKMTPFRQPTDAEVDVCRCLARYALVLTKRNAQGKMVSITA